MNMFKSNGGFTLVELIVVIAILAILAGVAVPAYSGYIARANDSAITSELSAIQTAAQSVCAMDGKTLGKVEITKAGVVSFFAEGESTAVEDADDGSDFDDFHTISTKLGDMISKHSTYAANGCKWESTGANAGKWVPMT